MANRISSQDAANLAEQIADRLLREHIVYRVSGTQKQGGKSYLATITLGGKLDGFTIGIDKQASVEVFDSDDVFFSSSIPGDLEALIVFLREGEDGIMRHARES